MESKEIISSVMSVLFAVGDAVSANFITDAVGCEKQETVKALEEIEATLSSGEMGLKLCKMNDKYQLATIKENAAAVKRALQGRRNSPLSNAALEVLAVIAYNQPTTKAYVEQVRGVESGQVLQNLISKDLVCERGRLDAPGRPLLYGTTDNFLRCFGLRTLAELPALPTVGADNETVFVQGSLPEVEN